MTLTAVKPVLDEETMEYINSMKNQELLVDEEKVEEYIKYSIKGGDKESFANFIAVVDRLERDSKRFKDIRELHIAAIKADEKYKEMYKEASEEGSELSNMALQRLIWNQKNLA